MVILSANFNLQHTLILLWKFGDNQPSGSWEEDFLATTTFVFISLIICPCLRDISLVFVQVKAHLWQIWKILTRGFLSYGLFSKKFMHTAQMVKCSISCMSHWLRRVKNLLCLRQRNIRVAIGTFCFWIQRRYRWWKQLWYCCNTFWYPSMRWKQNINKPMPDIFMT